ncbi:thioredoxin-dependent thiol peroxidase [Motilibacter sp. E257]|uniref:thioredoxin-dependent peroxiredoxin n=1 Tax=Motilibacter deserti TaxID=2714956 RepID=A0ABX0GSL7_9ACTN|nr:thioredoxin-dependent thiol peroxidase [Motilibacter deserti]NHC12834.1 thioredoxin-dependent thiol peroxidase [Motilibacter deserti]
MRARCKQFATSRGADGRRTPPSLPSDTCDTRGGHVSEDSATGRRLEPGDEAPGFVLPDADGNEVSLAGLRGRRAIVYFYPAAGTPGCTKQACDFRDSLEPLAAAGYAVVGISPDKPAKLAAFRDAEGVSFPLLSDADRSVMTAWGAFGTKTMYGKQVTGVIRSTFVLDEEGRVERAMYNVRATGHVAKLRKELGV